VQAFLVLATAAEKVEEARGRGFLLLVLALDLDVLR
jgi:hypothetical protein